jgi:HK97 family phage major capsid protein
MNYFDMKKQHAEAAGHANQIIKAAETAKRDFTAEEFTLLDAYNKTMDALAPQIAAIQANNTLAGQFDAKGPKYGAVAPAVHRHQKPMSGEYNEAFLAFVRSGGKQATDTLTEGFDPLFGGYALPALPGMSSAMYEGSNSGGGYSVSVPTSDLIVPLGLVDLGVRAVANAIATATDIKIPVQASFGTAAIKAESGGSTNTFSESDPTLSQFTLSAYMMGLSHTLSWELLQDVKMFQEFGVRDLLNAVSILEDGYFVTGSGSGQPQGLIGNVGTGTGSPYAYESTGDYLLQAVNDVTGTLKASYFANAGWLMSRATGAAIRKAQQQANLYNPAWTRENGRDLLHGFPVTYSQNMPALPTATTAGVTPILFGSFKDGYIIGDRGGTGTFVKVLDQPLATSGQTILLGYKRVDGRVRIAEAIQGISISHS